MDRHATLKNKADSILIVPETKGAIVVVNGKPVKGKTKLKHLVGLIFPFNSLIYLIYIVYGLSIHIQLHIITMHLLPIICTLNAYYRLMLSICNV